MIRDLRLRPSAAARWLRCPAFATLDRWNDDEKTESPWINEGTAAHYVAERCFKRDEDPRTYLGREIAVDVDKGTRFARVEKSVVTAEMVSAVETLLDVVRSTLAEIKVSKAFGGAYSEKKVSTRFSGIEVGGTADFVVVSPRKIAIVDFKYGENHIVEAVDNDQLTLYLLAAVDTYRLDKIEELRGVIVQPRGRDGTAVKTWIIDDPATWIKQARKRIETAVSRILGQGNDLTFNPSPDACLWCPTMKWCRGLWSLVEMIIHNLDKEVPDLPEPLLRMVLSNAKPISDFVREVERHSTARALSGERFEGFKLVEGGRSPWRQWSNPSEVVEALREKIAAGEVTPAEVLEPLSPAKMEKVLGAEFVDPRTIKTGGDRPTILVPESDRRPPIATARDEFEEFLDDPLDLLDSLVEDGSSGSLAAAFDLLDSLDGPDDLDDEEIDI